MRKYQRYIATGLLRTTLMVAISLTAIVWLMQALRLVDFIVNQGVSIGVFLKLSFLLIPSVMLLVLPVSVFSAVLFFYHKLKIDSEISVLQAIGLSRMQLSTPAIMVAFFVTITGYIISLYLLPVTYREFRNMQFFLRNNYVSVLLQEGVFANPVDNLMVYVREREKGGVLKGILVHDTRRPDAPITMMADSAVVADSPSGPVFMLSNGNRQEMREGKLSFLAFESYPMDMASFNKTDDGRKYDEREFSLTQLFSRVDDSSLSELQKNRSRAEAHQRIIWPFYSLTLVAIALAVIMRGEFNRRQRWKRNIVAVGIACTVMFAAVTLRSAMANNHAFMFIAYGVLLVPFTISLWLIFDQEYHKTSNPLNVY